MCSLSASIAAPERPSRTAFQRDRERIVQARAFRRLAGKTQVFTSRASDHFRSRLTHTIEVAQIARCVAQALGLKRNSPRHWPWSTTSAIRPSATPANAPSTSASSAMACASTTTSTRCASSSTSSCATPPPRAEPDPRRARGHHQALARLQRRQYPELPATCSTVGRRWRRRSSTSPTRSPTSPPTSTTASSRACWRSTTSASTSRCSSAAARRRWSDGIPASTAKILFNEALH